MKSGFLFLALPLLLCACVSAPTLDDPIKTEEEYKANFEETWRAVQQAIISYPLKSNNMDIGQIQTASIRGSNQFKTPQQLQASGANGHRYTLTFNVLKVNPKRTKVTITKETVVYRDFVSEPENKVSDGLEEMVLLYRIGRELDVEKAILRASKSKKPAAAE